MDRKRYYSLAVQGNQADIYIYGDITSWPVIENDVSSYNLAQEIQGLETDTISVHINSYGGEVAEGLAIYNALRQHKAKVRTLCDGFACSAASVVFMAGDERVMSNASLLMIHNAWMLTMGDQNDLRKNADDLEIINAATIQAYLNHVNISEDKLKEMMDAETWISAADALEMGFATEVVNPAATDKAAASLRLRQQMADAILSQQSRYNDAMADLLNHSEHQQVMHQPEVWRPELKPQSEPRPEPDPEPEPEPNDGGFFSFLEALANKLGGDE